MKKILIILALTGVFGWTACQKIEEEVLEEQEETAEQEGTGTWTLTIQAEKNDGSKTKGLAMDGDEATASLLQSIWIFNEPVLVYLGTDCVGNLSAEPDQSDAHKATLTGVITTNDITEGVTCLTLFTPRETWEYTGQNGKLLRSDDPISSIDSLYHYTMASNILVTAVSGDRITTEDAVFSNLQSIYRLSFRYNDGKTKTPINTKSVVISSANGHLVQSETLAGVATEGDISVSLDTATADPFFVALRNGDETNAEVLTFTVVDETGVTFRGSKQIPAEYKPNGTFVSAKNASLTTRLELSLSATEVETVL